MSAIDGLALIMDFYIAQVTQLTDRVCTAAPTASELIVCVGWASCVKEQLTSTQFISACSALCCAQASPIFLERSNRRHLCGR